MNGVRSERDGSGMHRATQLERWAAVGILDDLAVVPLQSGWGSERLCEGLLGCEAGRQRGQGQRGLCGGKEPVAQGRRALERLPEALHVYDVYPDTNDHSVSLSLLETATPR